MESLSLSVAVFLLSIRQAGQRGSNPDSIPQRTDAAGSRQYVSVMKAETGLLNLSSHSDITRGKDAKRDRVNGQTKKSLNPTSHMFVQHTAPMLVKESLR